MSDEIVQMSWNESNNACERPTKKMRDEKNRLDWLENKKSSVFGHFDILQRQFWRLEDEDGW